MFWPIGMYINYISVFGPNCIFFRKVKAMKSVPLLVVYPQRHKIWFLHSFTSCILQWHWHIMMLIQPCTMPALCIIKLSVSSLKRLLGISNQLSEWVLPYLLSFISGVTLLHCIFIYQRVQNAEKTQRAPHSWPQTQPNKIWGVLQLFIYSAIL